MWDDLKKEVKGRDTNTIAAYIENYGFQICTITKNCVYAVDKYGYGEYFYR